ncbi:NAD-dependent succinate-semialdehyde dehydrogenase [Rhizobium sp. L1K21]|uniref:NAD-dependent succinate-semialdehyde dehydrogenase n=1 Tax=Rhizobium sp. L1K21 TaxID=2954933 RepID=UPI0020935F5E|nr:NAD-dependent succinate-semialdehyde dehydrogenase [Rhizobium sp. L1K21]MCO6185358.1 NAD-dependent succinate-semialdehyde dehydrogenase [Rhizobium sp. L1K21]
MNTSIHSAETYPALRMHIDGEWVEAGDRRTFDVVNPATGSVLAALPLVDAADLDRALDAAQRGFKIWRNSSPEERAAVLNGAARLLRERIDVIARNATLEEGKTVAETRIEVLATAGLFEFYAGEAKRIYGRVLVRPDGARSIVMKEPVGPVAAFAPWNFPIANPGRKLGAPIAAGCSVILKPAEEAPASAIAIVEALVESGLPAGVCQLVFGVPNEVSTHLLASPIIRKVSFTGSTVVGKHLMKLAADNALRTTMELGGHAPVIVFDDCDFDKTIQLLTTAKARNAGQVCVAPTRYYIHENIHDRFVSALSERMAALKVGNGLDPDVQMGPMANSRRPEAIEGFLQNAMSRGGRILTGGERIGNEGFFFQPTVLTNVSNDMRIMNEEPFGPVAATQSFREFDQVVEEANRLPFGLAAYAFTENARTANRIGAALESGMVGINAVVLAAPDSPFQGVKQSGHGSEDGPEGVAACLVTKSIHQL